MFGRIVGRALLLLVGWSQFVHTEDVFALGEPALCTTFRWSATNGALTVGTPFHAVPASRASEPCVAIADAIGEYVQDYTPTSESSLRQRFYVRFDGHGGASNVKFLTANAPNGREVAAASYSNSAIYFYFDGSPIVGVVPVQEGAWYGIEMDWSSGTPGALSYRITGPAGSGVATEAGQLVGNNSTSLIETISVGAVSGAMPQLARVSFDAYASSRVAPPGLPCRCDATGDRVLSITDIIEIQNEILGRRMARAMPDCNMNGVVSITDVIQTQNLILQGATCPGVTTQLLFSDSFAPRCTGEPDSDTDHDGLADCREYAASAYGGIAYPGTHPLKADTDGDALSDGDEVLGTAGGLNLPALGVSPLRRDMLIEYDWLDDSNGCALHSHRPVSTTTNEVRTFFAAAPNLNPDGSTGLNVIQDYGQGGAFSGGNQVLGGPPNGEIPVLSSVALTAGEYRAIKDNNFATSRKGYFHYVLMVHRFSDSAFSGYAQISGDSSAIAFGCPFPNFEPRGTLVIHELGHNLSLRHGGFEDCNHKPNYNSLMNYRFNSGTDKNCDGVSEIDYVFAFSRGDRAPLNEFNLNENNGVCGPGFAIDWNRNGIFESSVTQEVSIGDDACQGLSNSVRDNDDWAQLDLRVTVPGDSMSRGVSPLPVGCEFPIY